MVWRCELCNCDFSRSDKLLNHNKTETHSLRVIIEDLQKENNELKEIINNARSALNMDAYLIIKNIEVPKVQNKRGSKVKCKVSKEALEVNEEPLCDSSSQEKPINEVSSDLTSKETTKGNISLETPINEVSSDLTSKETPINEVSSDLSSEETPINEVSSDLSSEETPINEVKIESPPPKKKIIKKVPKKEANGMDVDKDVLKIVNIDNLQEKIIDYNLLCKEITDLKISKKQFNIQLEELIKLYDKITEFSKLKKINLEKFRNENSIVKINLYPINNHLDFIDIINKKLSDILVSMLEEHITNEFYAEDNSVDLEMVQKIAENKQKIEEIQKKKKESEIKAQKIKKQLEIEDAIFNQEILEKRKKMTEKQELDKQLANFDKKIKQIDEFQEQDKVLEQIKKKKIPEIKMELYSSKGKKI